MAEILNANPTIRNASDLPTRRGRTSSQVTKKKKSLFASSIPSSTYLSDPFASSSDSDSEDDDAVEPIDEQEIYGTLDFYHNILSGPTVI